MLIGVPRELLENESRVAATPKTVQQILKLGFDVIVEHDAGFKASFEDQAFLEAGAKIGTSAEIWQSDIIFKVNAPTDEEIAQMKEGATLVSFIWRMQNPELMKKLTAKKINVLAMDAVPRISRAQALDALSSMANISGYRAVIELRMNSVASLLGKLLLQVKFHQQKCWLLVRVWLVWRQLVQQIALGRLFVLLTLVLK